MTLAEFDRLTVSTAMLAAALGLSRKGIAEHVAAGHLRRVGHGEFLLAESLRLYTAHQREMSAARGGPDAADVRAQRARVLKLQGDKLQVEMDLMDGKLMWSHEVEAF